MRTRELTFLIYVVWLAVVIVLIAGILSFVHAAEMKTCHVYANRTSAEALRRLLGMSFVDVAVGRFMYRKAYTQCLAADELPAMEFTAEEQTIVDGLPQPVSVPAGIVKGEPLCIRNGMKTIYRGKHWRCRK